MLIDSPWAGRLTVMFLWAATYSTALGKHLLVANHAYIP